jgi:hypothetical protein
MGRGRTKGGLAAVAASRTDSGVIIPPNYENALPRSSVQVERKDVKLETKNVRLEKKNVQLEKTNVWLESPTRAARRIKHFFALFYPTRFFQALPARGCAYRCPGLGEGYCPVKEVPGIEPIPVTGEKFLDLVGIEWPRLGDKFTFASQRQLNCFVMI